MILIHDLHIFNLYSELWRDLVALVSEVTIGAQNFLHLGITIDYTGKMNFELMLKCGKNLSIKKVSGSMGLTLPSIFK